jgi:acyl-CoA synthetase (NDP forming)
MGIPTAPARLVTNEDDAVTAAREIGYPTVLKASGPEILHKSDVGGIVLGLGDDASVRAAYEGLASRFGRTMTGVLVQQMVPDGVEVLVGGVVDPTFGPLVACGSGGVLVDLLADTAFRLHPLTDLAAAEMVDSLKGVRLLRGYRGHPPADERAVVEALLRVSALMTIAPEIQELDINPLKVLERGVMALDVRVRVSRRDDRLSASRRISY